MEYCKVLMEVVLLLINVIDVIVIIDIIIFGFFMFEIKDLINFMEVL